MAFPWTGKKEVREPGAKPEFPAAFEADISELPGGKGENPLRSVAREAPSRPSAGDSDPLPALTQRLENLGQLLDEAKEQVTSYLLHRESQSSGDDVSNALARKVDALAERLEQGSGGGRGLEQKLDALYGKIDQLANATARGGSAPPSSDGSGSGVNEAVLKSAVRPVTEKLDQFEAKLKSIDALKDALLPAITKLRDSHVEQHNTLGAGIRQLGEMVPQYFNALPQYFTALQQQIGAAQQHAGAGLQAIIDILRPPQPEAAAPAGSTVGGDWQEALLGGELAHNPALNLDKNQLLNGVLSGDPGACGLVGSFLLFRSAAADKMPPLLKDIGEAFYRWQPKTFNRPSELEKALVEWLMRACDQAGMANTIELVNPGERFDSLRHNASRPGVEITQVLGWIVLRDNGKVYTKASVAVK
ncbi:MAG: hypothetical protein WCJ35_05280 [Planctomycetota bacterium]